MNINKDISKGGLFGALLGTLASTQTYKTEESTTRKVIKTGVSAGLGYIIGSWIEKLVRKKN
jgi:hypothetical protein